MTNEAKLDGQPVPQGFGVISASVAAEYSGLEFLRGVMDGRFPAGPIFKVFQFRLIEVEEGRTVFTSVPSQAYMNPIGTVHGGYAATLLDSTLACCVQTLCPVGYSSTSVELKVNFVRPILPTTGRLFAEGTVVHPGRQLATSQATLKDEAGKLYAHGTQTCSVFKIPV